MPIEKTTDKAILHHPNGASAEVLLYGATVISWKSPCKHNNVPLERLFVSSKASLDGSKAVRGGIPVVFPCFGAPAHPEHNRLKQHGFARTEVWTCDGVIADDERSVSVKLTLEPTTGIKAVYDKAFHLSYEVTLTEYELSTTLHVKNTSTLSVHAPDVLSFQALFHNYVRAPSSDVIITPLQSKSYYDKTDGTEEGRATAKIETRAGVDVRTFTDSVYEDAPQQCKVAWPSGGIVVKSTGLKNLVIWNPQKEAGSKLADMEDGGWEKFVCIEPGHVLGFVEIEPGRTWTGQQVLTVNGPPYNLL